MATFLVNNMTIKEAHQKNKPKELGPPTLSFTSHLFFATNGQWCGFKGFFVASLTGFTVAFGYMYLFGLTLTF